MAFPSIFVTDFVGTIKVVQSSLDASLEAFIAEYTQSLAIKMLGNTLFNEIEIANPLPEKYTDLLNGILYKNKDGKIQSYQGALKGIRNGIYFYYMRENYRPSSQGLVSGVSENSTKASPLESNGYVASRWNVLALNSQSLHKFIHAYVDRELPIMSKTVAGNIVTINTPITEYLQDGDVITIAQKEYTVQNLIEDVSFEIETEDVISRHKFTYTAFESYEEIKPISVIIA